MTTDHETTHIPFCRSGASIASKQLHFWLSSARFCSKWRNLAMGLTRIRNLVVVKKKARRFSRSWIRCFRILPFIFAFLVLLAFSFYSVSQNAVGVRRNMHYFGYSGPRNIVSINHIPVTRYGRSMLDEEVSQFKLSSLLQANVTLPTLWARSFMKRVRNNVVNYIVLRQERKIKYKANRKFRNQPYKSFIQQRDREYCIELPKRLIGHVTISSTPMDNITEKDILKVAQPLANGGEWFPGHCVTKHNVAIIIPYRDRRQHLLQLLYHLHPMLQRQQIHYRIFVVEQYGNDIFNKGALMNAAFSAVLERKLFHGASMFGCFIFHDVDMIPEDDRNLYTCTRLPVHLSVAVNEMNYTLPYRDLVGGVFKMNVKSFLKVNGYSNLFWGWGGEDDDMAVRLATAHLPILRPPSSIGRYTMIRHTKRSASPRLLRHKLLSTSKTRARLDGLNSMKHRIVNITNSPLYSLILVDVGSSPSVVRKLYGMSYALKNNLTTLSLANITKHLNV